MNVRAAQAFDLSREQRQAGIQTIIDYFAVEREEEIGIIAAEDLLDMFLESVGKTVYNRAVDDTKKLIAQSHETLLAEIELSLKKEVS